jgi:hypothetical protein
MAGILQRLYCAGLTLSYRKVSVLIPTRKRPTYLKSMLDSYHASITDPAMSEFVFRCDNDDIESVRQLAGFDWPIIVGPRRQGYKSLPSFYNEMVRLATGDLLICGNDDMLFETKDWPRLIIQEANKYPDGIFNIGVSTGLNDEKFPFSIVSRQFVDKLGKINDERLLFSDIFLLDVAKHFHRAVVLRSVTFRHDWAGHGADQTRLEANKHEFNMVFANAKGEWTEHYRQLHEQVVREAVRTLDSDNDRFVAGVISDFERYTPGESSTGNLWPPQARPTQWGQPAGSVGIHYGRRETAALIKTVLAVGIARDKAVLSSFQNGLPSILWGHLFKNVTTIAWHTETTETISDGQHTIEFGSLGDTRFLYRVIEKLGAPNLLVLDELRYANLISPYYLFRRALAKPGMVVFMNTKKRLDNANANVCRFLGDLRNGCLDGVCHDIRDISEDHGLGVSYEIVE